MNGSLGRERLVRTLPPPVPVFTTSLAIHSFGRRKKKIMKQDYIQIFCFVQN
ncbi:Uncharacterized protein APZ42_019838 [Daphnia magna]|uniref:Uncharacterized protein n=1 Tax=Daphnia magna TaxID=35525 RepID=A0A164XRD2_9CRUS|nr:Uncharacterized protein APZ42_019838 [Daphnia magna]